LITLRGTALLNSPTENRGTAFTHAQRSQLGLHGLLPPDVETLELQAARAYEAFQRKNDDLERHIYLRALQDTNEVLFYRLLLDHIQEMTPIVYTPVVALGCQEFSHIYRRPRGLFISYPHRDSIPDLLRNRPHQEIDVIVVTDGERILGIGDQGVGGLGIPIGKLSLYTLIGGIHPARTLPVVLDVGTNNPKLLNDPHYLGWRHERVTGAEYIEFIDRFVDAVKRELPGTCLQWEDFSRPNARPLLNRYRDQLLTFNDDIQGTAAVTLGAIMSAIRVTGASLKDQRLVFLGAGSAGVGVADYLRAAMVEDGLSDQEALSRFWFLDSKGLLQKGRPGLTEEQIVYARDPLGRELKLAEVVDLAHPTVLVGLATSPGAFTQAIVENMAAHTDRPIILPLSNPTARTEAIPEDLIRWTNGRAIIATGSPFQPVEFDGKKIPISQCNNMYIFPAVGLAVMASRAQRVTDSMMLVAARALAAHSPAASSSGSAEELPLLPRFNELRSVARDIAVAIAMEAQRAGVAPQCPEPDIRRRIEDRQWIPSYDSLV
jgi:malate dehydrogenase (oxaloacetate-decarboxylating)